MSSMNSMQNAKQEAVGFNQAATIVSEYLERSGTTYRCAAIFGSVAREQNKPNSDVDVLVVTASARLVKRNVVYAGQRLQTIEGSESAFRKRIADTQKSKNDFVAEIVRDCRLIHGDEGPLSRLKSSADAALKAGAPPITYLQFLSLRCRCADAVEKLATISDRNHRMVVAFRAYNLLHELASTTNGVWLSVGANGYPQFVKLAGGFAERLADELRQGISSDDYRPYIGIITEFFAHTGGFTWSSDQALPV